MIPVNKPSLLGNEKKYLIDCVESGWISSEGPYVKAFEDQLSAKVHRKYGVAVCNGTAAIDAAIVALNIGVGDEVIVPTFTIISCINQIVRSGAVPVLVDSDAATWNMNVSQIEEKITPRTKAILVVHIYGLPVDLNPVLDVAKKYNLKIIEDAAEMHGQEYRGQPCGSFGDISIFSFYPNKHITTGEGGMILTNDDDLFETCRSLRNLCFQPEKRFVHNQLGWNLRMTNMQAALGVAQLEQLDMFVGRKRAMGNLYNKLLHGLPGVQLPLEKTDYADNIYWVYGLVIDKDLGVDAEYVMSLLNHAGIGTRPFFCPMHQQPILKKMGFFSNETYSVSENMYKNGFYVPSGLALEEFEIEKVAEVLWKIFNQLQK
jgi:perosamine synthetase